MRILHTADWHLGKTLKGQPLLDDQIFIRDEIFEIIRDEKIDAVLISGDVYDRAIPPAEAVTLFDETLTKLAEKKIPTLIIAGNHDSATRLNFGRELFARQGIFITAKVDNAFKPVVLEDKFGEIYFSLTPFAESDKLAEMITSAREKIPAGKRSVVLAHAFLTGGVESESERKFVGGTANVGAETFAGYDYVALGHLHRPQKISAKYIRYAGSPLKYSFDEADHKKSVTIVELDAQGFVDAERIPLTPKRDVIVVKGIFSELINRPPCNDYAQIILTDDAYIYDTELLRDAFPNFLEVKRENHLQSYDDAPETNFCKEDSIPEQFAKFFESVNGEPLNDEERATFEKFLHDLEREEREV